MFLCYLCCFPEGNALGDMSSAKTSAQWSVNDCRLCRLYISQEYSAKEKKMMCGILPYSTCQLGYPKKVATFSNLHKNTIRETKVNYHVAGTDQKLYRLYYIYCAQNPQEIFICFSRLEIWELKFGEVKQLSQHHYLVGGCVGFQTLCLFHWILRPILHFKNGFLGKSAVPRFR